MCQIRHSPLRLPRVAAVEFWLNSEAALFYRIHPPSDETTPIGHVCGPCPPSKTEGSFSHRTTGTIGPPSLHIRIHVGQQDHLRRYLLKQRSRPPPLSHLGLRDRFSRCRWVGALAPLPLVLLDSGGLFCSMPVCGCACTPPTRLVGFWGIVLLGAGVWVHLRPSLRYTVLPHLWPHPVAVERATVSLPTYVSPLPSFSSPPETPSPTYSTSFPASSASPPTPAGIEDLSNKIVLASSSPGYSKLSEHI